VTVTKTTLRCGDTLHVLIASCEVELLRLVEATTKRLLRPNGHSVEATQQGWAVWVIDEPLHPLAWSSDGNKVRANRVRYTRDTDGSISRAVLRQVWVAP
jgi:hypothetical protein